MWDAMSTSVVTLDDQTLLDLYAKLQSERLSLGTIYPVARRDDFLDRGSYQGIAAPVVMLTKEQIFSDHDQSLQILLRPP
jgi:hypothetical protein